MAMESDESEMILIVFPDIARYMNEAIRESGIVIQIINVARSVKSRCTATPISWRRTT